MPNIRKISETKKLQGFTAEFAREHQTSDVLRFDTYQAILIYRLKTPVSIRTDIISYRNSMRIT